MLLKSKACGGGYNMNIKKYLAEFLGTMVLVLFGCGTAVVCGGFTGGMETGFLGVVAIALAFGLAIVASAYLYFRVKYR